MMVAAIIMYSTSTSYLVLQIAGISSASTISTCGTSSVIPRGSLALGFDYRGNPEAPRVLPFCRVPGSLRFRLPEEKHPEYAKKGWGA